MNLRTSNILLSLGLVALAAFVLVQSQSFSDKAAQLPRLLAGSFIVLGAILATANLRKASGGANAHRFPFAETPWKLWFAIVIAFILFGFGADSIGFYESTFLFLLVTTFLLSLGEQGALKKWVTPLAFAFGLDLCLYIIFATVLRVPTPSGILF